MNRGETGAGGAESTGVVGAGRLGTDARGRCSVHTETPPNRNPSMIHDGIFDGFDRAEGGEFS